MSFITRLMGDKAEPEPVKEEKVPDIRLVERDDLSLAIHMTRDGICKALGIPPYFNVSFANWSYYGNGELTIYLRKSDVIKTTDDFSRFVEQRQILEDAIQELGG